MTGLTKAVRGMHDILPEESASWQLLEQAVRGILESYGYREIRLPVVEKTELFERSIGDTSDIVSKEMYTFPDRNGEMLTLRPEGTAGCVRAVLERSLLRNLPARLWYSGQMFRHERPQKGRLRQFHQIGIETFGIPGPDIDAEILIMCARIWRMLGLDGLRLEINSLGNRETRENYRNTLLEYFMDHSSLLDAESRDRLDRNPLRILDSKVPEIRPLIEQAPSITDSLDGESAGHFTGLQELLDSAGISYRLNPRLVRGLDYYNRTVFEWISDNLGAQGTVCAGGRYDGLVEQFGGEPTPAIGFAMGLERLVMLANEAGFIKETTAADIYFIVASDTAVPAALTLAEQIRDALPQLRLLMHCGGGSFKSQFKKADRSGARLALIIGDNELADRKIGLKPLRSDESQTEAPWSELITAVSRQLGI